MSDVRLPVLDKQTAGIFATGLVAGLATVYLPSLASLSALRSLLFLAYPLATHGLALALWYATRHQPALSPLSSLRADSPLRYTYLVLVAALAFTQLALAPSIARSVWAPTLVYLASLLAYAPLIAHCTLAANSALRIPRQSLWSYAMPVLALLACVGCGFPYVGSEYALSRRDAGLAWYVLRLVLEVCYTLVCTSSVVDDSDDRADGRPSAFQQQAAQKGVAALWSSLPSSGKWLLAHAVRIALWALLAYVCRLYEIRRHKAH